MDELSSGFTDFGLSLDMQLLQRINDIRCQHGFSVEDIIDEWIAFSENHQVKEVTDSTVEMFENKICGKLQKSNDITVHHGQVKHTGFQSDQFVDLVDEEIFSAYSSLRHDSTEAKLDPSTLTSTKFVTPHGMENSNPSHLEPKVSSNVRDFNPDLLSSRQEKHGPNETIASIGDIWIMEDIHPRITVEIRMSEAWMQTWDDVSEYGYQYHGSYAKASSINKHIHTIGDLLLSNNSQFDEPVSLAIPTQESCVYTGIVVSESTDSKLNPSTCLFMGSREVSQGHVVKLDLSAVNNYSIFPGQVIAVEGTCTGKKLIADALFTDCPLKQLDRSNSVVKGFKMMISAGPFTTSNNLDYACLYELLTAVKSETPEVLILVGPFLDVRHPLLQTAKEKENFPAVILNRILAAIHTVCHKCQTEVVTIPSQFDLLHHQVYPQSPFELPKNLFDGMHHFPNPCIMSINGVSVAISSADILKHMAGQMYGAPNAKDRMSVMINHLFTQQSFYPLFPPHNSMSIDIGGLHKKAGLPFKPDILILPSELKPFIKLVYGGICVNPGMAAKEKAKGSYALLSCPSDEHVSSDYGTKISCKIVHI